METTQAYLERKLGEIRLLNDCLEMPLPAAEPRSVDEIVESKFRLTAALRAEHERRAWKVTETSWAHAGSHTSGPFKFTYDYQRADLEVHGPSFYEPSPYLRPATIYTASGMAAMSSLLFAVVRLIRPPNLILLPGSYGETVELVQSYIGSLKLVRARPPLSNVFVDKTGPNVLLIDSSGPNGIFEAVFEIKGEPVDLVIFDTTCFDSMSARIRRVLRWARARAIPVVMVRSHTKLDSLGAEYGRLGSISFVPVERTTQESLDKWKSLPGEAQTAVRLLGVAAVPAHFPPYVGTISYRKLTRRRIAAMLRNCRRATCQIRSEFRRSSGGQVSNHGLYFTLGADSGLNQDEARNLAERMSADLGRQGLPLRHAGSFGFDFSATEWFQDSDTGAYMVRVAVSDLPTRLCDDLAKAIARWWLDSQKR